MCFRLQPEDQSGVGRSALSTTRTCTGPFDGSSLSPSCSGITEKIDQGIGSERAGSSWWRGREFGDEIEVAIKVPGEACFINYRPAQHRDQVVSKRRHRQSAKCHAASARSKIR